MRQYFQYGDVQAARRAADGVESSRILERGPSIYSGAEDVVIEKTSKEIVEKAQFLLGLDAPCAARTSARKRWTALQQSGKAKVEGPPNAKETFAALAHELHAAHKIQTIFEYRRKAADKKKKGSLTVSERLLRFLQTSHFKIEEIEAVKQRRNERANFRADGIHLTTQLLEQNCQPNSQIFILMSFMKALRESKHGKELSLSHVHYLNGVEGASIECIAKLSEAFTGFLKFAVEILRSNSNLLNSPPPKGTSKLDEERRTKEQLVIMTLQACGLDYDLKDHYLIEEAGLISAIESYLSCPLAVVRKTAWKLFETLLPRAGLVDETESETFLEEPSGVSKQIMAMIARQIENVASKTKCSTVSVDSKGMEEAKRVVLLHGVTQIGRANAGKVAPYVPMGLNSTTCFWLFRPRSALEEALAEKRITQNSRVRRGPSWEKDDQDVFEGNLGTVVKVNSPTEVTVKWDGSEDSFTYR